MKKPARITSFVLACLLMLSCIVLPAGGVCETPRKRKPGLYSGTSIVLDGRGYYILSYDHEKELALCLDMFTLSDNLCYNETGEHYVPWEQCTLRTWLNTVYFERFSQEVQDAIVETEVTTTIKGDYSEEEAAEIVGPSTMDKVFILSEDEIDELYYSVLPGERYNGDTGQILTRSPFTFMRGIYYADRYGRYGSTIADANMKRTEYVRPAFWVNMEASEIYESDEDSEPAPSAEPETEETEDTFQAKMIGRWELVEMLNTETGVSVTDMYPGETIYCVIDESTINILIPDSEMPIPYQWDGDTLIASGSYELSYSFEGDLLILTGYLGYGNVNIVFAPAAE